MVPGATNFVFSRCRMCASAFPLLGCLCLPLHCLSRGFIQFPLQLVDFRHQRPDHLDQAVKLVSAIHPVARNFLVPLRTTARYPPANTPPAHTPHASPQTQAPGGCARNPENPTRSFQSPTTTTAPTACAWWAARTHCQSYPCPHPPQPRGAPSQTSPPQRRGCPARSTRTRKSS